jgi:DNA mismatch endonuclease (patch repair protein)
LPDVVDQQTRSRMMSGIRGKNTDPELQIRKGLHAKGFRFRIHSKEVPGKPDLVLPKYHAAIFVHGCFWHGHDCALFKLPGTRTDFWKAKIASNCKRDTVVQEQLAKDGWRSLTIWECAMRGPARIGIGQTIDAAAAWLSNGSSSAEIRGRA